MEAMLVTYAEAKSLQDDANEKKASKSYEAAADLFEKAAEKFMLCGLETEAKVCDQGKDAVLSQLALLEQANILCDEAETVGRNGVEQCKIDSIQEAVTLLTAAINIFTKVGAPEGIAEAQKALKLLESKRRHLENAIAKAAEAEQAAEQEFWETAAELFNTAKLEFEAAGCSKYATMADKKRDVAIKHSKKAAKKRTQRKFGEPPAGERPDGTLDLMGAKLWDEEMRRYERERAELKAGKPLSAAQNLAEDAREQARIDSNMVSNLEEELRTARAKGGGLDNDYQIRKLQAELEAAQAAAQHSAVYAANMEAEIQKKEEEEKKEEERLARCKMNPAERTEEDRKNRAKAYLQHIKEAGLGLISADQLCADIAMRAQFRVARIDKLEHAGGERVWLLAEESRMLTGPSLHMVRIGKQVIFSSALT